MFLAAITLILMAGPQDGTPAIPGEAPVERYREDRANAGALPFRGDDMARAFNGQDGIRRIVGRFVSANFADPRVGEIFMNQDRSRLERVLFEQFCYILNAGCTYTGRDMRSAHKNMGVQQADMNRVVENLQKAMRAEHVSFAAQNRFLAKLAPMRRDIVGR
ncbi:group I truncated hemoglobin [Sphingomonas sp. CFBP 13720]|uniref:group I truncated hemoglobin n=1 Tax=Sphingomonas sp. CFBP 13720 TaxID=2775302 RepID=UPI0017800D9B|nr:group 1 truncated hemoglobin [Sphingomonas sp. CFBP 13720]MBD8678963.1 group 1 truncated hemoglobin [Sphingomonas sp. CFBP 13720]